MNTSCQSMSFSLRTGAFRFEIVMISDAKKLPHNQRLTLTKKEGFWLVKNVQDILPLLLLACRSHPNHEYNYIYPEQQYY